MSQDTGCRGDREYGTIPGMLAQSAQRYGNSLAVIDGDTQLSFAALADQVMRCQRGLLAQGVSHGDRVAIWAPNMWEWIVAGLAVHAVGGVLVPINTRYKGGEAAYILARSGARMLLTVSDFLSTDYVALLRKSDPDLPELQRIIILRGHTPEDTLSFEALCDSGETISATEAQARVDALTGDDLCDILFTSGTTGQPKGAMCTHAQTLRAYRDWSEVVGLTHGDRYLVVAPFFHCFGYKAGWLAGLMMGATILPQAVFDANAVLARIGPDRITMLPGPPALYQTLLAHPDLAKHDISSLRLAVTGAAVIPVELIRRMRSVLGFETVITGYGLTEACGIATMCRYDDPPERIASTSGRAIPGVEVRVVDANNTPVPSGESGEVLVRGYNVMSGYFGDPTQSAATVSAEGWLHTGDIGVMDADGYIRITDRKKDMFIVGGFNAYPAEIENILLQREDIAQVAVVGTPDPRLGEIGVAYILARPGVNLSSEELHAWSREHMANFKVPRRFVLVDSMPMNATGKILKYVLRERARQDAEHAGASA